MTGDVPFASESLEGKLQQKIRGGHRPSRPDRRLIHHGLDDRLWSLLCQCWSHKPSDRPSMRDVVMMLQEAKPKRKLVDGVVGPQRVANDNISGGGGGSDGGTILLPCESFSG